MRFFRSCIGILTAILALPGKVYAQRTLDVSGWYAGSISWADITGNISSTLRGTLIFLASTVFIGGAFMMTLSYKSENQTTGKGMMIGAIVGLIIGIATLAIFNTVLYFVYGP